MECASGWRTAVSQVASNADPVHLWRDLLDLKEDHPTATTFAKLKKGEKAAKLEALFNEPALRKTHGVTEAQDSRIGAWLPEGME